MLIEKCQIKDWKYNTVPNNLLFERGLLYILKPLQLMKSKLMYHATCVVNYTPV